MAQTYTLEEAAQRLGVPLDVFKRRIKDDWKSLRSFRDGATLRFRASDIDELARTLGEASDPGLQLGSPGSTVQPGPSEEFLLAPEDMTPVDSGDDIFSVAAGDSARTKKPKSGDSNVRLEPDSGVRKKGGNPAKSGGKSSGKAKDSGHLTEEIDLDMLAGPKSGVLRPGESSAKLKAPRSGPNLAGPGASSLSSNKIPGPPATGDIAGTDSSSEFELSLDTDSDSFELQLNTDQSEEIDLGGDPVKRAGQSGINLANPKDSGVSLEKKGPKPTAGQSGILKKAPPPTPVDDSDDFELSLDNDSSELEATNFTADAEASSPLESEAPSDSDSEFELSLDDSGSSEAYAEEEAKGDIFETDFSLPPVEDDAESGSEVVAVESSDTDLENSDFDLALDESDIQAADDESASQVVLLDDDSGDAPVGAAGVAAGAAALTGGRKKKKVVTEDDAAEDEDDVSSSLAGVRRRTDEDEDAVPLGYAPPAKWPGWVIAPLALTFLFTFLGGIMSYELLRGMWGYHNGQTTTGGLSSTVAGAFGMETDKPK